MKNVFAYLTGKKTRQHIKVLEAIIEDAQDENLYLKKEIAALKRELDAIQRDPS